MEVLMRGAYNIVKTTDPDQFDRIVAFSSTLDADLTVKAQVEEFCMNEVATRIVETRF
jgi:hypothetical protein